MPGCCRFGLRWSSIFAVTGVYLTMAAGCQSSSGRLPASSVAVAPAHKTPKLNTGQLADLKVAMGRSLEKRGDDEQAAVVYQEALEYDAGRADACLRLAVLADRQGKFHDSHEFYRKALALQPSNPDILCDQGYSLYLQDRYSEAAEALRKAIALDPNHRRAHNNLGLLLARSGDVQAALTEFRRAGCTDADAHVNLAFALTLQERWQEARQSYQQARVADPNCQAAEKGLRELESLMTKLALPAARQARSPAVPVASTSVQHAEAVSKPDGDIQPVHCRSEPRP